MLWRMANGTPESEFSIECFQNYSAGEVFVQGLAGVVDQTDVESLIRAQKTILYPDDGPGCSCCGVYLVEPYVECCECPATVCTQCYASGQETLDHRSDHGYRIRRNDFPIFDNCNWTAKEELRLLKAIGMHGYGNWEEISKNIQTKSELECEEHYKKYYIDNVQYEELELLPHTTQSMFPQPLIPFLEMSKPETTRCPKFCTRNLAGYNAFRSEFAFNYDNNAEKILDIVTDIDYNDELMMELTVAVGNVLNSRLKERRRRYDIIKRHGLLLQHKFSAWCQRFCKTLGRPFVERMCPFMQFTTGIQFDVLMERMNLEEELSMKIARLYEYRRNGIRTLNGVRIYKQLQRSDEGQKKKIKFIDSMTDKGCKLMLPVQNDSMVNSTRKYHPKPLEIEDLPGYHSLSGSEKDLCSQIRLLPQKYLEIREQLIAENCKLGFLRLLDARKIVRIDVNKTRKVYDFLEREGYIRKPC